MLESEAVSQLLDKQAIVEVVLRRARAGDHGDEASARSCYHPGATEHHGAFNGTVDDFITTVSRRSSSDPTRRLMWTAVGHTLIDLDGDVARAESHALMHVELEESTTGSGPGSIVDLQNGVRYLDRFERRDGVWAIVHRDVVYDWSRRCPATDRMWDGHPTDTFLRGRWDTSDPVYTKLLHIDDDENRHIDDENR